MKNQQHSVANLGRPLSGTLSRVRRWTEQVVIVLAATSLLGIGADAAAAGTFTEVAEFGSNPGNLRMFKYLPDRLQNPAPLVVALHGCQQTAAAYDDETGWRPLADRWGFALLLPEQKGFTIASPFVPAFTLSSIDVNNALSCFNWFDPHDNARGQGEALSIKQMIERMQADHAIDPKRIFITGLSAGGAMTAVMLSTYPEVFAGGGIIAGLPYGCASRPLEAFQCMNPGKDLAPAEWASRVRAASSHAGSWPRVSIWQGGSDLTVNPINARELLEQWTSVHRIDHIPDGEDAVKGYPHRVYKDADGRILVETYTITGMGHGTPVDPGSGEEQCGKAAPFILDANICSSYYIAKFWDLD
jgi:poly(hydroxyalkanoate) depolymerase family esterase